jgi:DNA-binding response OmpR family regulator
VAFNRERRSVILVVEDVEETRHGMERLLAASGYQVSTAGDEEEAVFKAGLRPPDLILISLGLNPTRTVAIAKRIRELSALGEEVAVIILGAAGLDEGAEVGVGSNIYLTRPDNFDQLRAFLSRLLRKLL